MTPRERTLVTAVVVATACAGVALGAVRLAGSRRAAADAADGLAECRRLAERITAQRGSPPGASRVRASREAPAPREADVIRRIESAAKSAGLPPDVVERIEPMPVEPVGAEQFGSKPTAFQLQGVTLRQALTFLHAVGAGRPGLQLKRVRMAAPMASDTRDRWSVEGTLTQLAGVDESGDDYGAGARHDDADEVEKDADGSDDETAE